MKIFDTFTFFNELDILELRLNILNEYVDKFILVEATRSHQNKPKPLYFQENLDRFEKFLPKIEHVILDEFPQYSYWSHENHQRDHIYNCINKLAQDDDIIFISDLDEIWDPEKIIPILSNTDSNKIYRWRSRICYFYFNLIAQKEDWIQPMFLSFSLLKELIEKKQYSISQNILRDIHSPINIYTDEYSGWHFSYTGPVIYKLQNFLHSEFNNLSEDYIKECVETKINPFYKNKMHVIGASEFNSYLPKYVMNNLQKYKKYLLQ